MTQIKFKNGTVIDHQTRREFWTEALGATVILLGMFVVIVIAALIWNQIR